MTQQPQEEITIRLARLRGMLQAQRIRLEVQQANTPDSSSVLRWQRLIQATEQEIQRLESQAPQMHLGEACDIIFLWYSMDSPI